MTVPLDSQSTRPYLVRAIYEWCSDHNYTPYVAVQVDDSVQVPREFVRNGEIVLNVSFEATSGLKLGNDYIEFKARFGGVSREIMVPMHRVLAIYALENGQGMAFPVLPFEHSAGPRPSAAALGPVKLDVPTAPSGARVLQLVGQQSESESSSAAEPPSEEPPPSGPSGRPALKRVK
jgi:stringent starvation protein B